MLGNLRNKGDLASEQRVELSVPQLLVGGPVVDGGKAAQAEGLQSKQVDKMGVE
jgi:hypothetical protein